MAKAHEIPELDGTAPAAEGVAKVLRVRFDEVLKYRESALDFSDIKGVHDMRVAIRRLRSAVRDFKPLLKKEPLKEVKIELKSLADALGNVRDRDVEIAALEKLQTEAETENLKEGIEKFICERRDLRETARDHLTKRLEIEKTDKLREEFTTGLDKAIETNFRPPIFSFKDFGRLVIAADLEAFCDLSPALYAPLDTINLHKLRIAAKRLRYAMQLFAACWDDEMKLFAKEVSEMQTFLGDTHDHDVWIETLCRQLKESENNAAGSANDRRTIINLLAQFIEKRNEEYISALRLYDEWKINYFIARLKAMIL